MGYITYISGQLNLKKGVDGEAFEKEFELVKEKDEDAFFCIQLMDYNGKKEIFF